MGLKQFSLAATGALELRSIPAWSTQHFEATGRPLRIAIDQANWWYRNITAEKEAEIEQQNPCSHPREKRIMERIFYLLRMNIQLLFVFDGREQQLGTHAYSEKNVALLKELLDQLGVPRHDAPGTAVAECARLQDLGVVDAVWTDETDVLFYGTRPTIVQFHKPEGEQFKSSTPVLVGKPERIRERTGLSRDGFVMRAILLGDDCTNGLTGIGADQFDAIIRHRSFESAARMLDWAVDEPKVLGKWRALVTVMVKDVTPGRDFAAPPKTFPDLAVLTRLLRPVVSHDEVLLDLPSLQEGWFRSYSVRMLERYRFLLRNFNSQIHETWIARDLIPIELNDRLRRGDGIPAEQCANSRRFKIRPAQRRRKERVDATTVTVNPLDVLPELRSAFPFDVTRGGRRVLLQKPTFRAEDVEVLDCVLRRGLPESDVQRLTTPQTKVSPHRNKPKHVRKRSSFPLSLTEQQDVIATKPKPVPPPPSRRDRSGSGAGAPFRNWSPFERRGSLPIAEIKRNMGLLDFSLTESETPPPVPPLPLAFQTERRGSAPPTELKKAANGSPGGGSRSGSPGNDKGSVKAGHAVVSMLKVPSPQFERRGSMPAPPKPKKMGLHLQVPSTRRLPSLTPGSQSAVEPHSVVDWSNVSPGGGGGAGGGGNRGDPPTDDSPVSPLSPLSPASPLFSGDLMLPGELEWDLGIPTKPGEGEFVSAWHSLAPANPLSKTASRLAKRMSLQRKSPLPSPGLLVVSSPPPVVVFETPSWGAEDSVPSPIIEVTV